MSNILFLKLLRDIKSVWFRIALMILAMSVTLIVFSGLFYTRGIARRELRTAYMNTNPASATILFGNGLDYQILEEVEKQPDVLDAAIRTQLILPVMIADGQWEAIPIQVFVSPVNEVGSIEKFDVVEGIWPSRPGEILLETSSFKLLNLKVGDDIIVRMPNGESRSLHIGGAAYYPGLAPSFQDQRIRGFMTTDTLALLQEGIALDELKIQVTDRQNRNIPSGNRGDIIETTYKIAEMLKQEHDAAILEIQVPTPYAHPHQGQMESVLLGLLVFGIVGLLLSAILVSTMFHGLLAGQIPQIGILKAIGARTGSLFKLYLSMALIISVAATAIAMIPGMVISRMLTPVLLGMLGVEYANLTVPFWMYMLVIAVGIGVPILFTLFVLIRTSLVTVREALNYREASAKEHIVKRAKISPSVDRTVLMAFRNVFRRRGRLIMTVGLLAFAGAVFVSGLSIQYGYEKYVDAEKQRQTWDVVVRVAPMEQEINGNLMEKIGNVAEVAYVEGWSFVATSFIPSGQNFSITRTYPDQGHGSISVTAVPSGTSLVPTPGLESGRWFNDGETGVIVIGNDLLNNELAGLRVGDTVSLSMYDDVSEWELIGIAEGTGHGGGIYITEAGYMEATGVNQPNLFRVVTNNHDEETREAVAAEIDRTLREAGVVVRSSASVSISARAQAGHMLPLILMFLAISIAMGFVGFAGLASTMSVSVMERMREFGIMSAIGASQGTIRWLVMLEGVFLAILSCIFAIVPTVLLTWIMVEYMPMHGLFAISIEGALIWIFIVVVGSLLATFIPAYRASRLTVREALTQL